jgi:hypothetical protein
MCPVKLANEMSGELELRRLAALRGCGEPPCFCDLITHYDGGRRCLYESDK